MSLGERVLAARKVSRKKSPAVARDVGISVTYLRQIEKGHAVPSLAVARGLADALGLSASELVSAVLNERDAVTLDMNTTELHRAVAHRLAAAWELLTSDELNTINNTLAAMRLPDGRRA